VLDILSPFSVIEKCPKVSDMKKMFSKTLPFRWRIQDFEEGRGINRLSLRDCPKFIRLLGWSKKCSSFKISFAQQTQNMNNFV